MFDKCVFLFCIGRVFEFIVFYFVCFKSKEVLLTTHNAPLVHQSSSSDFKYNRYDLDKIDKDIFGSINYGSGEIDDDAQVYTYVHKIY